jgi:hypothetical protein
MAKSRKTQQQQHPRVLGDFTLPEALWAEGGVTAPLFPSPSSWQWFLRQHRDELAQAEAIAIHAGRLLVNEGRVELVAKAAAIAAVRRRPGTDA